jgi:hypothetical protein
MHSSKDCIHKERNLRGNNIIHSEEKLTNMYSSFLSAESEGTMKLELYTLLNDQKEILGDIQYKIPTNLHK